MFSVIVLHLNADEHALGYKHSVRVIEIKLQVHTSFLFGGYIHMQSITHIVYIKSRGEMLFGLHS